MDLPNTDRLNRRNFLQLTGGLALATFSTLLVGCGNPATTTPTAEATKAPDEPQRGGVLRIAVTEEVTNLDPTKFFSTTDTYLSFMLYDNLTRRSDSEPGAPLYPQLAESWEMSDDALTYTFFLRKGVTFQHGTPFTAKDVEFSIQRLLNPDLGLSSRPVVAPVVDRLEIIDDHTIRFHLKRPSVTLPYILSTPGLAIMPHDRTDEQFTTEPSGTGPFKFKEQVAGERTTVVRNENYWDAGRPYLDEVQLLVIPETPTAIASLTSGTVDMVTAVGIAALPSVTGVEGIRVLESPQGTYPIFVMSVNEKPFDDVRVRQALKHSIDRNALQKVVLQGRGLIMNDQPVAPFSPLWANVPPLAYDVEKAKALLAEAGYPNGLEVTLTIADATPGIMDAAVVIQESAKAAGITINLNRFPVGAYWDEQYMQVPFFISYWDLISEPDPQLSFQYISDGIFNESGWGDARVDTLISESRGSRDLATRKQQSAEIQQIISSEGANIIPYSMPIIMAARDTVRDLIPGQFIYPQFIWLAPKS